LNYDHYHTEHTENHTTKYNPMPNPPWPLCGEPEEPKKNLWQDIKNYIHQHIDLPDERLYDVKTAWILCTWIPEAFNTAPYWRYLGTPNNGKTRALEVDQHLTYRGTLSASITEAALYRLIEKYKITYLLDETEIYNNEQKQATQHVLNAGYRRGQQVFRCEQAENGEIIVVGYSPYGFKALAGTRLLKDTLESRCIPTVMQRNTRPVNYMLNIPGARKLRSRLLLWRFRRLADLEEAGEACEGSESGEGIFEPPEIFHQIKNSRLVELFAPLIDVAEDEVARENIIGYAFDMYRETAEEESSGAEAEILGAIIACHARLESGKFATRWVAESFNGDKPEREHWKASSVGRLIKTLGFKPKRMGGGASGYVYDSDLIMRLSERYDTPPLGAPSLPSLSSQGSLLLEERMNEVRRCIAGGCECVEEIVEEVGIASDGVLGILRVLERDGLVFQSKPGIWRLV
jgi:hypothetical protein